MRRKLYRSALKEKPSKENSRLRRYNQNSEKRQSVINCFQDLLGRSPAIASNVSQFMERLVNGFHQFFAFHSREREGSAGLFASSRHLQSAVRFLEHFIRVLHVLRHNAVRSVALEENLPQRYLPRSIFTQKSFSNPLR